MMGARCTQKKKTIMKNQKRSQRDRHGFPLLPDLVELNLEATFSEGGPRHPVEEDVEALLKEAEAELEKVMRS
jgi:hypothetical protein